MPTPVSVTFPSRGTMPYFIGLSALISQPNSSE